MLRRNKVGLALLLLISCLAGNASAQGRIVDHAGNVEITGFGPFRIESNGHFIGKGASGDKIHVVSHKQQLTVDGSSVEGNLSGTRQTEYSVQEMTLGGGVKVVVHRRSTRSASVETATITGETAVYTAANQHLKVTGSIHISDEDPGADQSLVASGSSADLELSNVIEKVGSEPRAIRNATLEGPVVMDLHGTRLDTDAKGVKKRVKFITHGTGDHMVYNDAERTLTLKGHVNITGDDPGLGGEIQNVSSATIHLTATGEAESIDLNGDPVGKTTLRQKELGGKRRK